jgi:hypothetical protein
MKAEKISKEILAKIKKVPFDVLIEKHEMYTWDVTSEEPYLFEIDGKRIAIEFYIEPHELELTRSFTSPDEQYMVVMLYHNDHEAHYIAIAKWHPDAQIYVTLFFHSTHIGDWDTFKNVFIMDKEKREKSNEE